MPHGTMGNVGQSCFSLSNSLRRDYNPQNASRPNSSRAPRRRDLTEGREACDPKEGEAWWWAESGHLLLPPLNSPGLTPP